MSDNAAAEGKKKGKLPVMIALVAVLFGGGFFGMKMKGGGKHEKPKVELGKIVEMEEKLVNLTDGDTYLRTTIAFHLKKGFEELKLKDIMPAIEDTVNGVLKAKSRNDLLSLNDIAKLKVELATKVNETIISVSPPEPGEKDEEDKDKDKGDEKDGKEGKSKPVKREHQDWDSDTGPVLKVYFKAFAVQ